MVHEPLSDTSISRLYRAAIWQFTRRTFPVWQRLGFHITPNHYYEPIPDTRALNDTIWERETEIVGFDLDSEGQNVFLDSVCSLYKNEFDDFGLNESGPDCRYFVRNGVFGGMDGYVLYSMIRHFKPRRIIEIGSGWSTLLSAYALERNREEFSISSKLVAIEPYPTPLLKQAIGGPVELIEQELQTVDPGLFQSLQENDILFIDSTHVAKINSDVCYECLEILPRINKGVLVHFHDIYLPGEYPKDLVLGRKFFWNEAYLLQAFLTLNKTFEIIWATNYMRTKYPENCQETFKDLSGCSFWIRRTG
jgi:hypothetical protein